MVVGADFRDLRAVEALCAAVPSMLDSLDVLINNACQTVRRPPQSLFRSQNVSLKPPLERS